MQKVMIVDKTGQEINLTPLNGSPVTPSDTVDLANPGKLYVHGEGDISFVMLGNNQTITYTGFSGWLPVIVKRVNDTGTDATEITVYW
jgi:hypothetical protein